MNGKGDTFRPVDGKKYRGNYDDIFSPPDIANANDGDIVMKNGHWYIFDATIHNWRRVNAH